MDFHYIGPFKVLERYEKCFKLQLDRKIDTVGIDRLKSAYVPTRNQWHTEQFIDYNENIEKELPKNNENNDNAAPENQQIQGATGTEKKKKTNGEICL